MVWIGLSHENHPPVNAFWLSVQLAAVTTLILLPVGIIVGRWLAISEFRAKPWLESALLLPLVLPPTVIGYYLLVTFSPNAVVGKLWTSLFGTPLVFSFAGLVLASCLINLPFAVQPMQLANKQLPDNMREAAYVSGLSRWKTWWRIELPMTFSGVLTSAALVFAHTLGEFGVVLMVGGNIEGRTRTLSIAIYDSVQSFDMKTAGLYSLALVLFSMLALVALRYSTRSS